MSVVEMDYSQAHNFVARPPRRTDARWEGWDLLLWKPTPFGYMNTKGVFRKGRWGVQTRITVNERGTWEVPSNYVRPTK